MSDLSSSRPFKPEVIRALLDHGIRPAVDSNPAQIRSHLNDLYTFQLRDLKLMRREAERILGPQPLEDYRRRVQALQDRYRLLSLPADRWRRRDPDSSTSNRRG